MNLLYLFFCVLISLPLASAPREHLSSKNIYVGDAFDYQIEFENTLPKSLSYPTDEFFEEGEDLPLFKVLKIEKTEKNLRLKLRFYAAGEFILPISWEENAKLKDSEFKILIHTRLSGTETDLEENEPPLSFSGQYIHRLIIAILLFLLLLYFVYAMFVYWKQQNRIVNADWENIPELEMRVKKLYLLEEFLKKDSMPYKDFCYFFTSYCKEEYSYRLKTNLLHKTDSEFLAYLYDHSGLEESVLREIRNIFRTVKYSDFEKQLTQNEAQVLWLDWKQKLKL
ncbi:hypothetical protein EHQ58_04255 [Leptospira ognonensis]|uniref:DUF4129 domain-containing protein n=1 Tax=Leptospira ognonensis TaxID=2484945 RepID=A0A4R9KAL7_9LEPT|nr:hypothetical protein [Leptospira ognonensis]TGL61833.1 hypothetical protein EHQ58_04255 [Leptospira ognonensis]